MIDVSVEFPGPTPQLVVDDAERAIRFYREAFGADELVRNHAPDGRIMHCELLLCGGRLLVIDDFEPDQVRSPARLGGTTVRLHLYVSDVDRVYAGALAAGAESVMAPEDAFWGDRYAIVRDPHGHQWSIATPREDLSVSDLEARGDAWSLTRDLEERS
ncbi:MAG TPA: VOC family protein [Actinophytocola sp.]|uniref:VOC family protein n=1 Tax=Actinophytocola sp. TaxID=1872138 RepID=UPI002DDC9925|nr:VOC family protein [Actinophytocola sp.]HEV2779827.1 VOC family protein [Actinophytocola sp.]